MHPSAVLSEDAAINNDGWSSQSMNRLARELLQQILFLRQVKISPSLGLHVTVMVAMNGPQAGKLNNSEDQSR